MKADSTGQPMGDRRNPAKRVVFYHDSHDYGGMELYMMRLLCRLDSSRFSPMVMIPGYSDAFRTSPSQFIEDVNKAGIPLLRTPDPGNSGASSTFKEIIATARLLRSHKIDLLHIHTCRTEGARKVTIAARMAGVRAIIRSEHYPPSITSRSLSKYLVKPFDWLTNYIVTGSEGDRQGQIHLLRRPASKVYRIYNSIELEKFDPNHDPYQAKVRLGVDPNIPVVGSVGRLVLAKGHRYLIEALSTVIKEYGPVNLFLVGDGDLRTELEELTHSLGLDDFVTFFGFQENVLPYMQATDIAAMPSLWEVFSMAMLEFMALGKPVIASDHSSFQEAIVDGENGLLVPMKDSQALAHAMLKLLNDEQARCAIGAAALKRVHAEFGFQRLTNEMMNLYDRVLDSRPILSQVNV